MDDTAELFLRIGLGDAASVAEMLRYRPELARARDGSGLGVLQFARYMREDAILAMLIERGPALDVFEAAALDRSADIRTLVRRGPALITAPNSDGWSPLHVAARHDAANAASELLAAGASVDLLSADRARSTPLHVAVESGAEETCRLLLRGGADPNALRRGRETPLMLAAGTGGRAVAEMLIARNANTEWRDEQGRTAADHASAGGHLALAARLRLGERVIDREKA
jgi:ankyrin repeat protein